MNSLEWRVKKLEDRILGQDRTEAKEPLLQQFTTIANQYKEFIDSPGNNYSRFLELYNIHKDILSNLSKTTDTSDTFKAELILAYHDELVNHLQNTEKLAQKADQVLDISKWPDLSSHQEKLDKLQTITKEQHLQSNVIDQKTEYLIELYNDIIGKFRSNMAIWNDRLEAYENEEKKSEDSSPQ